MALNNPSPHFQFLGQDWTETKINLAWLCFQKNFQLSTKLSFFLLDPLFPYLLWLNPFTGSCLNLKLGNLFAKVLVRSSDLPACHALPTTRNSNLKFGEPDANHWTTANKIFRHNSQISSAVLFSSMVFMNLGWQSSIEQNYWR